MRLEGSALVHAAAATTQEAVDPLQPLLSSLKPVAVTLTFREVTPEDYDRLLSSLVLTPHGSGLPGCLFHWVQLTPEGWTITEVWQNRALFDVYRHDEVEPTYQRLRLPAPEVSIAPVHNYLESAGLID